MKFTSLFNILSHGDSEARYISFESFFTFLKAKDANIRRNNLRRVLNTYTGGINVCQDQEVVPVASVIRYSFHNADTSSACAFIAKEIQHDLLKDSAENIITSSYELYNRIAKTPFHKFNSSLEDIVFKENDIETLVIEHKPHFSETEWKNICLFEVHFSNSSEYQRLSYESLINLKFAAFQSLLSFKKCSDDLLKIAVNDIKDKRFRISAADDSNQVVLSASVQHNPLLLEKEIFQLLQIYCDEAVKTVISFDTIYSKVQNTLQIVIGVRSADLKYPVEDLCQRIYHSILRKHNVHVETVYLILEEHLKQFKESQQPSRFILRDEIETRRLDDKILRKWHLNDIESPETTDIVCSRCHSSKQVKPLTVKGFDIVQEWFLSVPIATQILLETFINQDSYSKSKEKDVFLKQKLTKLYRTYEQLLNVRNKNFIGIFQQAQSNELLIEYKSVSTVFDITASAGSTASLTHAETSLKKKGDADMCYYNTYLKEHDLQYQTVTGENKQSVSMRDCHVILMLDDLVRLKYVADPNPGEHRSKQICTIPITLQGLPLDSQITSDWHSGECDGTSNCECKNPEPLRKHDVKRTLLSLQGNEQRCYSQFSELCIWTSVLLWDKLPDEVLDQIGCHTAEGINKNADENLGESDDAETEPEDEESEDDIDLVNILTVLDECDENQIYIKSVTHGCENVSSVCENILEGVCELSDTGDLSDSESDSDNNTETVSEGFHEFEHEEISDMHDLEISIGNMSILEQDDSKLDITDLLSTFSFTKYCVPPLLCRHPPPAIGKDDSILKIKEILDNVLKKTGYEADPGKSVNRILCGPDNKIGKCLLDLIKQDPKYKAFLPEFPLLHLRKSKITILFSAYKDAGLSHIVRYMRDDGEEDWKKLISLQHIDIATKYVRRISLALHLAFLIQFAKSLEMEEKECFWSDMQNSKPKELSQNWTEKFQKFIKDGCSRNATFALHNDMMTHCKHVVAIALSERLGGADGYTLLLAAVKESLLFSFVNSASSYAPYCVQLLYQHYSAGYFHTCMKQTLYSTPFNDSDRNFACDTKREIDHLEAKKGFRSGSTVDSVTCRMSLMDILNETKEARSNKKRKPPSIDQLGWGLTEVDEKHIFPTVDLILRQGGLSNDPSLVPCNVYTKKQTVLPCSILDEQSNSTAEYLLLRYLVKEGFFQLTASDIPDLKEAIGPKELLSRAKRSKGVTIKRTTKSKITESKTEGQLQEEMRKKVVAKKAILIDRLESKNNACQAIVKPDSSKPKVMKAKGMQKAIKALLEAAKTDTSTPVDKLVYLEQKHIPRGVTSTAAICLLEFAGVKFKLGNLQSGREYVQYIQTILQSYIHQMPNLSDVIICEEKYMFTPDDLKAGTREQRKIKNTHSVDHLKTGGDIINADILKKKTITDTSQGKSTISLYLAKNLDQLRLSRSVRLIVDSELHLSPCTCSNVCSCNRYSVPVLCTFVDDRTAPEIKQLPDVRQRKGEAEMAIVDWLVHFQRTCTLKPDDSAVSIVTSGDIDAIYIHLYAVSKFWKRDVNGRFINPVYVILQKPRGVLDIYDITGILLNLERSFHDHHIGEKVALGLCIGGNDFVPKIHQISHEKMLDCIIRNDAYRNELFLKDDGSIKINKECFSDIFKYLFCPKKYLNAGLSYEDVRALSIGKTEDLTTKDGFKTNDPRKWLPPKSAIFKLCDIVQLQVLYLETLGNHDAISPDFLQMGCLQKNTSGEIEYDFGPECYFETFQELPVPRIPAKKRRSDITPQKGQRKKKQMTSTPKSQNEGKRK